MAAVIQGLFGGSNTRDNAAPVADNDFADFASAPEPTPEVFAAPANPAAAAAATALPYSKWYNVHERHSLSEFRSEGYIFLLLLVIMGIHLIGTRANRAKARAWAKAHSSLLRSEFALVGFGPRTPSAADADEEGLARAVAKQEGGDDTVLREVSLNNFAGYATGRFNIAFLDIDIQLLKRYNPVLLAIESATGFFFDSMPAPVERMTAIMYPFDGKEALTVPGQIPGASELRNTKSGYDNFVWAVVHKERMKQLRDERYDVSITVTKDHPKLPEWATVMSESAEITDILLTPALIAAVTQAGDDFEHLIITDQPIDQPTTVDETAPKKRAYLSLRLPASGDFAATTLPIFAYFIGLADLLVEKAHFRPEALRKVKSGREEAVRRLQRADEEGKAEERALEREKAKKAKRDKELSSLDAKSQKKYLEKERERELKKSMKKGTQKA